MSNDGKSLPVSEMDTNLLFEKFTIDEIRNIEKRTRADIERKKEDLRTMVGERYRDLIEAADTITDMKNSAQNVMSTIGKLEVLCTDLKNAQLVRGNSLQYQKKQEIEHKRKEEARFYGVASQIKLLLDMPEKIWTSLDCEDYLSASRLFLLSQHINTSLQLDSQHAPNFLYWFPVLNRQWAAISHFKLTILQGCRRTLKEPSASDQKIAESLCSILLLENSNPRQVFNEFLLARTSAVQQLFHGSNQSISTKDQIGTIVQLVTTTIHQIHAVFYKEEEGSQTCAVDQSVASNLLWNILTKVTSEKQIDTGLLDLRSSVSAKTLPRTVTEFCPSHKSPTQGVSKSYLQDNCKQWIQTCIGDVKVGVTKLLNFVNTVKHLATIRDTVWDQLAQDTSMSDWGTVCVRILDQKLSVWEDLLRPLFVDRVKALIRYQLDASVELTERQVSKVLTELHNVADSSLKSETDLASYIWSESTSDIAPNTAWTLSGSRTLLESGGLMMKAKAYTPVVQSLCKNFDEKLRTMLDDAKFYLHCEEEEGSVTMATQSPFNKYQDTPTLLSYIQTSCVDEINGCSSFCHVLRVRPRATSQENLSSRFSTRILNFLGDQLREYKQILEDSKERNIPTGNRLLVIGRLCAAICDLMPHLKQCVLGHITLERQDSLRSLKKPARGSDVNTVWDNCRTKLIACQHDAYRLWIDHIAEIVLQDFRLAADSETAQDLVRTCSRWEEVSIEEETEDGKKISSKIAVPSQASWYLLSLLYSICQDLNQVGGHAVGRSVLQHLVCLVSDGILKAYETIIKEKRVDSSHCLLNQQRALQLLFDVKFVLLIIPRKDDSRDSKRYNQKMQSIISRLEEIVDPFDLDVFSPYIQSNLSKLAQRSSVLLGALTSIDKSGLYGLSSRPAASSQQEQHNVILLSSCPTRFSTLPLSTQMSRYSTPQPIPSQTLYSRTDTSGPSLSETAGSILPPPSMQKLATSSSFYDKLGTGLGSMSELSSWFSNIGSKS